MSVYLRGYRLSLAVPALRDKGLCDLVSCVFCLFGIFYSLLSFALFWQDALINEVKKLLCFVVINELESGLTSRGCSCCAALFSPLELNDSCCYFCLAST